MRHFFGGRFNILTFNIFGECSTDKGWDLKSSKFVIIHHNLMAIMKFLQVKWYINTKNENQEADIQLLDFLSNEWRYV